MSRSDARSTSLLRRPSRTVPAGIVAAIILAAGVALVWASVAKLREDRWPAWVGAIHHQARTQTWGATPVIIAGAVLALSGLALIVLAVKSGTPTAYQIDSGGPGPGGSAESVEFAMTRRGVAKLATAHADLVDGVDAVSARVGRRKVRLAVTTPSARQDQIEQIVTQRVRDAFTGVGFVSMPTVTTTARTSNL